MSEIDRMEVLALRRSVRAYTDEPLPKEIINKLKAEITMTNTHEQGFRFQLIINDPNPMRGMTKSYGSFRNPRNYLAAVVDTATPFIHERAGYFAEKFVIKATELGLGTCIVGSTFNSKEVKAQMRAGEKILFLVFVGFPADKERLGARLMSKFVHLHKRTPDSFFEPADKLQEALALFPDILERGLTAVAEAPSALNRQPVRVSLGKNAEGKDILIGKVKEGNERDLIDLGIAKFNFNYATFTECEWGNGAPMMVI